MQKVQLLLVVFALAGVALVVAPVIDGQATYTYDVSHTFTFTPNGGVTALPSYFFGTSTFALPRGAPDVNNGSFTFGLGGGTSPVVCNLDRPIFDRYGAFLRYAVTIYSRRAGFGRLYV